jgi:hypothetical protein
MTDDDATMEEAPKRVLPTIKKRRPVQVVEPREHVKRPCMRDMFLKALEMNHEKSWGLSRGNIQQATQAGQQDWKKLLKCVELLRSEPNTDLFEFHTWAKIHPPGMNKN